MGTETSTSVEFCIYVHFLYPVKLNNPQMGTETNIIFHFLLSFRFQLVKLNNPQMGTETI